jgi:hypothetical protein
MTIRAGKWWRDKLEISSISCCGGIARSTESKEELSEEKTGQIVVLFCQAQWEFVQKLVKGW